MACGAAPRPEFSPATVHERARRERKQQIALCPFDAATWRVGVLDNLGYDACVPQGEQPLVDALASAVVQRKAPVPRPGQPLVQIDRGQLRRSILALQKAIGANAPLARRRTLLRRHCW